MRLLDVMMIGAVGACSVLPAAAQVRLDRADPTITERSLPRPAPKAEARDLPRLTPPADALTIDDLARPPIASAVVVDGNRAVQTAAFAPAIVLYLGRALSRDDLASLAGEIAAVARRAGYPFARASIAPQAMSGGVLHVRLEEGSIDAVRVIGAINPLADRILTKALVTGAPVRAATLERAILLVGDMPGVRVKDSKFIEQNGFNILLVTIVEDKANAYVQVDNRGSAEIGPIRATMLANYRGLAEPGDELGLIAATTPINPSEFAFIRARYGAPVDDSGAMLTVSGSYGRANPGGWLAPLNIIGNSMDLAVAYTRPLLRSRIRSLSAAIEFRALKTDQTLLGSTLRDDRLTTVTGSLIGSTQAGFGVLRGQVAVTAGLPLAGVTHQGDRYTSRSDGDARFVTVGFNADWSARVAGPVSVALASAGQLASRPLLATAEIGVGGPGFARAFDYAERTGDQGIMGSGEIRADLRPDTGAVDRLQLYTFVDGGYVDNLRNGIGGGSLLSTGAGARVGNRLFDGMIEIAFPLNADRFDTGSRRPRVSFRLSRSF